MGIPVMNDKNMDFFREFIGPEWLNSEFNRVNTKTPLKEAGNRFSNYHPWVHFMYELEYLCRRAKIEGRSTILMGKYYHILCNAGMLLERNIDSIQDQNDAIRRLRHPDQFYDFIWELEVKTMLNCRGAGVKIITPSSGITYDGIVCIEGIHIPYECKNKVLDNSQYDSNMIFNQVLVNRLEDVLRIENQVLEIEFDVGYLEDIRFIVSSLRNLPATQNSIEVLGRYKIKILPKHFFKCAHRELMELPGVESMMVIRKLPKRELYNPYSSSAVDKAILLFKMPSANTRIKNLKGVLKKANTQLSCGGVVFIKLPYLAFEQGIQEIAQIISHDASNISAVKAVAIDLDTTPNGVKVSRKEKVVMSPNCKYRLPDNVSDFLSLPMALSKYKTDD